MGTEGVARIGAGLLSNTVCGQRFEKPFGLFLSVATLLESRRTTNPGNSLLSLWTGLAPSSAESAPASQALYVRFLDLCTTESTASYKVRALFIGYYFSPF